MASFFTLSLVTFLAISSSSTASHGPPARGVQDPDYLAIATQTANWLNATKQCRTIPSFSQQREMPACSWAMNSPDPAPANHPYLKDSLYYGSAGVALFFAQLYNATAAPAYRILTQQALNDAAANTNISSSSSNNPFGNNVGFYYGLGGVAFGLRAASTALPPPERPAYVAAALGIEQYMLSVPPLAPPTATTEEALWNNTDVAHGAAGAGLYLLYAAQQEEAGSAHRQALVQGAVNAGDWLLSVAEAAGDASLRWWRGPDTDGMHENEYFPTFCCGTAGVAYFLAYLSQQLPLLADPQAPPASLRNASAFLSASIKGANHVLTVAQTDAKAGTLVLPHEEEGQGEALFYHGWCGGAPGFARLFVLLHSMQAPVPAGGGGADWLKLLALSASGVEQLAVPRFAWLTPVEKVGPWTNLGQCCGAAAAGNLFVRMATAQHTSLPSPAIATAVANAKQVAEGLLQRAKYYAGASTEISFPSPEEHATPASVTSQAGWMQGAAGVGSFFLQMHLLKHTNTHGQGGPGARLRWPDEPEW